VDHWPQPPRRIGLGDANADFNASLYTSTDTAALSAALQARVASEPAVAQGVAAYDAGATSVAMASGVAASMNGASPDEKTAAAGFTIAATAAAVIAGMTVAAASAVIAPMALFAYGGGYAIGLLIRKIFGITNQGAISCSDSDTFPYAAAPGDPGWITYSSPMPVPWQAYTNGPFEIWARPIIIRAAELLQNCKPLPGGVTPRQFYQGLIVAWNTQWPGMPMRTIVLIGDQGDAHFNDPEWSGYLPPDYQVQNTSAAHTQLAAWVGDPVQSMIRGIANEQRNPMSRADAVAPALPHPVSIQVADPPPGSVVLTSDQIAADAAFAAQAAADPTLLWSVRHAAAQAHAREVQLSLPPTGMSTGAKVATGAAVVGGAAVAGTLVVSYLKGEAVSAVVKGAWRGVKGWF
jgi:hypothetical protein